MDIIGRSFDIHFVFRWFTYWLSSCWLSLNAISLWSLLSWTRHCRYRSEVNVGTICTQVFLWLTIITKIGVKQSSQIGNKSYNQLRKKYYSYLTWVVDDPSNRNSQRTSGVTDTSPSRYLCWSSRRHKMSHRQTPSGVFHWHCRGIFVPLILYSIFTIPNNHDSQSYHRPNSLVALSAVRVISHSWYPRWAGQGCR